MKRLALALLSACAPAAAPPPARPAPPEPGTLVAELDAGFLELARVTHAARGDCPRMTTTLRPVIVRLRATAERIHQMQEDPALAKQLVALLHGYDDQHGQADAIVDDLATCRDDPGVRALVDAMPTL